MAISTSTILTILPFLFLPSSSFAQSSYPAPFRSFIDCFLQHLSPDLIYTSNSTSYESVLQSSAQNLRFLVSKTNQKPSIIVTADSTYDVSITIRCACTYGLQLRARSGGHDYEGMSYVSDDKERPFVVVDLAHYRSIDVDAKTRTAWVQAGATLGEVYYNVFIKSNGTLGFPAGQCPTVGAGGHVSGGGFGAMMRKFGTAADNVIDAKILGTSGVVLDRRAMGEDLFWAVRGGGAASFGVVLAYKLQLVEVPPVVTAFNVYRNLRQNATNLVTRWQDIAPKLDESIYLRAVVQPVIDSESVWNVNIQVQFTSLFLGNKSQFFSAIDTSFPELGLQAEDFTEMNWLESALFMYGMSGKGIEALLNRTPASNSSFKAKSDFVTNPITEKQWGEIWRALRNLKEDNITILLIMEPFGGIMDMIPESTTPFPHRKGNLYIIEYETRWSGVEEQESKRHLDSMRKLYDFMTPYVSSNPRMSYYSYKDIDLGRTEGLMPSYFEARQWGERYFKGNFEKLAIVKGRVDPMNFFRNEQSIPPLYYTSKEAFSSSLNDTIMRLLNKEVRAHYACTS
ncbi:berberine bridge enzyme-like 22 [Asparagus officinalis]|uniref:berberine bridge enzyme-like 22 n=1 Tax=Asparagus officinalis TaxID=4686 RepID=UPI00098E41F6|nr:berberine bridge enzyme-like 22 [Asparagus officinalis]